MKAYKTRVKLKDIKKAIHVPSEISSAEVEVIILSDTQLIKPAHRLKKRKNLAGIFRRYAKPELIKSEKENAWIRAIDDKHGIL